MSDIFRDWSFGGILRSYRVKEKITLREMCRNNGWDAGNYSKLETSKFDPPDTVTTIKRLTQPLCLNDKQFDFLAMAAFNFHLGKLKAHFDK